MKSLVKSVVDARYFVFISLYVDAEVVWQVEGIRFEIEHLTYNIKLDIEDTIDNII